MKARANIIWVALFGAFVWILVLHIVIMAGCATEPRTSYHNARRLMEFPGFQDAGRAAPGWVIEALNTIDELERERDERQTP